MIKFIKAIGILWAVIGFGNIFMMRWSESSEGFLTFGLIFNMCLFVLPGLLLYGICGTKKKSLSKKGEDIAAE